MSQLCTICMLCTYNSFCFPYCKIFCITVVILRSQQKEEWQKKRSFRRRKTRSTINRWGNIHESKKNLWNTRTLGAKTFRWSKDLEALVHDPVSDSLKPTLRQKGAPCSVHKSSVSRVKGSAREASINFIVYSLPSNFHNKKPLLSLLIYSRYTSFTYNSHRKSRRIFNIFVI